MHIALVILIVIFLFYVHQGDLHEGEGSADKDLRPAFSGTAIGKVYSFFRRYV